MAASAAMVARLRRMVAEPTSATYSDEDLQDYIELYPAIDDGGLRPFYLDYSTDPPSRAETTGWIPTYDLHAAAADIWQEKAASPAQDFDFSADGGNYNRSQVYEQCMKRVRFHLSRRKPTTIKLSQEPRVPDRDEVMYIGNLAEPEEGI